MALVDFFSVFLPYCLQKQEDGSYLVLNREYKPVGFYTRDWIKYEEHPLFGKIKKITKSRAQKLSASQAVDLERIYLYDDATTPRKGGRYLSDYLKKLELLGKLKIV